MSLRLEMLQVAKLAPMSLGDATGLVRRFYTSLQNPDGGFHGRSPSSDLYYSVFALDALEAIRSPMASESDAAVWEAAAQFVAGFGDGEGLDFVHLCCLARCAAAVQYHRAGSSVRIDRSWSECLLRRVEQYRALDGGYHSKPASEHGTAYGAFLAAGAQLDLMGRITARDGIAASLASITTDDGAWANEPGMRTGTTTATAAALSLMRYLDRRPPDVALDWIEARAHPQGGFLAIAHAPLPDLLSTATALHALGACGRSLDRFKEPCLDFIDTLWVNEGGFFGHWHDDIADAEYTFYALLALGHLTGHDSA